MRSERANHGHTILACLLAALNLVHVGAFSVDFVNTRAPELFSSPGGSVKPVGDGEFEFTNSLNFSRGNLNVYVASLTMSGNEYVVHMDTGSSDLWLDTQGKDVSAIPTTNIRSGIRYVDGTSAVGPVLIGDLSFGDFSVPQAFISAPGSNATTNGNSGLMGVGPPQLSAISDDLRGSTFNGKTVLENIFDANPSEPKIITFELSRSQTMGLTDGGTFTIGEVDSKFASVTSQPKLEVHAPSSWVVFMDGIEVNGQLFSGQSQFNVDGQGANQTLANLDTGTSLGFIPMAYLDAIYGTIPGAFYSSRSGAYIIPCDESVDVSFIFGGVKYPVHPIDTIQASIGTTGDIICYSGFLPNDFDLDEDFLIGDTFLRNVYSLYDFGSFMNGTDLPFVQLLSTTDTATARSEYASLVAQRNATLRDVIQGGDGDPSTEGPGGGGGGGGRGGSDNSAGSLLSSASLGAWTLVAPVVGVFASWLL